jgi:hypothetical protein
MSVKVRMPVQPASSRDDQIEKALTALERAVRSRSHVAGPVTRDQEPSQEGLAVAERLLGIGIATLARAAKEAKTTAANRRAANRRFERTSQRIDRAIRANDEAIQELLGQRPLH